MATYNGEIFIREQLDSFASQSRLPDELVVCDDCSSDSTLEIVKLFADSAPFPVIYIKNSCNTGYTAAFCRALEKCSGQFVFISDQDDVWFPEKIERIERIMLSNPEMLVVMNDAALTDANLVDIGLTKQGQICSAGLPKSAFVMGCCVAVRRELLDVCLPIPSNYKGHDNWIVQMADGIGRKLVVPDILQWYRRHGDNESQFIANRTTKITRGVVFCDNLIRAFKADVSSSQFAQSCEQAHILLQGVHLAAARASGKISHELRAFARDLEAQCEALDFRRTIRNTPRLRRFHLIYQLWRKNGYSQFSGLISALRDFAFR